MNFIETSLKGEYVIEIEPHKDDRGFFARAWCKKEMEEHRLNSNIVQCNISHSNKKGTVRGLHYQVEPYAEDKVFRCIKGSLFDVTIDLRSGSDTYGQWFGIELNEKNGKMIYIPKGFAHGFQTLEDDTYALYQVTEFYTPCAETGIRWDDEKFGINWPIKENIVISEKDKKWPLFG